jgi:uncharacterized protein
MRITRKMFFKRALCIDADNLQELVFGTAVLASGGGGDPYIGQQILKQALGKHGPAKLLDPARVRDKALVVAVGAIGASTIFLERFPSLDALAGVVAAMESRLGRKVDALVASEAGGLNATLPIALGLRLGRPVIDADGMGRAFPEGQMMTYGIYGGRAAPMILADDQLNMVVVDADDNYKAEQLARSAVRSMGNSAMAAAYPMTGKFFKSAAIWNTITLSHNIGRAALTARREKRDPHAALERFFSTGRKAQRFAGTLFMGKVVDVACKTGGGFVRGTVTLESERCSARCIVEIQNENLAVQIDERIVALVPDIITMLEQETAEPITTENLRYGQRVNIFGLAAPELLRTPEALKIVGPRAFGIDHDYLPIEVLAGAT